MTILLVGFEAFVGVFHVGQYLAVSERLLFLHLRDDRTRPRDFALVAVEDWQGNARKKTHVVEPAVAGVVCLNGYVRFSIRFGQHISAICRGNALHGSAQVGPVLQGLHLQIFEVALHRQVIESVHNVIIGGHGLIPQLLPKVRQPLSARELR